MVSCGMTFIKYLLFVFNLLFAISGIAILAVGGYILASNKNLQLIANNLFSAPAIVFIAVGAIVFLVSFLGCCGAIRNSNVMVMSFAVLIITIFLLELTAAIAGYVMRDTVHEVIDKIFNDTLEKYLDEPEYNEGWNIIQHDFKCCGVNGPADWKRVFPNGTLPIFCCPDLDVNKETCSMDSQAKPYKDGCLTLFESIFTGKAVIAGSIGLAVCFIQLMGVILACCLGGALRKDYETV